eukprot:scaffold12372_cov105-Skeletonema_marinoi.AAC.2
MNNFPSTCAYAKSVTDDGPDSSSRSFYDGDDGESESNEDWEAADKAFKEHNFSLSQTTVNDEYEFHEEASADECKDANTTSESTCIYDNPLLDNELSNEWNSIAQYANSRSPQKEAFVSNNTNDAKPAASNASPKKKRTGTLFDYVTKGDATSNSHSRSNTRPRLSHGTGVKNPDGSVYIKGKVGKDGRWFMPNETFLSSNKAYDGMAFTLGNIDGVDGIWKAECTAIWMRAEKTFIYKAAAQIQQKWVLVKKHRNLPQPDYDGKITIPLAELSRQLKTGDDDTPNTEKIPLCYEEVDNYTCSYYYERGKQVRWAPKINSKAPLAMDLFAGAGGASLGMQQAGWNVKYKIEWNKKAAVTLRCNFKEDATIFQDDIEVFLQELKFCKDKKISIHPTTSEILHIHGSPPCQGVSSANTSGGACDNQNNKCTLTFLDAIIHFQPKLVSMENVPGLLQEKGLDILTKVMAGLLANDYQIQLCLLESSNYGDAQARKRVILLASKKGWKLPSILAATHGNGEGMLPKRTAKDAIGSLEQIEPTETGCVHLDGKEIYDHYKAGTKLGKGHDSAYQLDPYKPANTMRKVNQVKHYRKDLNRYITARERARLQSFPDSFRFFGEQRDVFNQIGNAVPVKMAEAIGKSVMDSYRLGRNDDPV